MCNKKCVSSVSVGLFSKVTGMTKTKKALDEVIELDELNELNELCLQEL